MSRKRTPRKAKAHMDPLEAIRASRPFPEAEVLRILIKVNDAFAQLKSGSADTGLFDRLAAVLNTGLVRAEAIAQPAIEVFLAAQRALMEANAIYDRHQRFGFTGPGIAAMQEAVELYEQIVRLSTPIQMHQAQLECIRRLRRGQVTSQAEEVAA